ncbi:MAG: murein biosynthesis integral membrane protein MurJ [Anaerolineales bacterium]|nr:murein biosynthesis integral membrane protein MurJ [Anaerolineales bacterium]
MPRMRHIARSTLIVAVFFGLEKVLGFARQVLIARSFGLSRELDAFNAANNIPDLLFALISGGALAMALIPVLSEFLEKGGRSATWDLFSRVANLVFLVTAGLSLLVALFANQLVSWRLGVAPGFTSQQQALVADLMRLNLIATLLFSLSGLVMAGLQTNQHFLLPALAPSMYDLGALFGVLVLAPESGYRFGPLQLPALGLGVHGLVYGVILGAVLFLAIQVPGLVRYQFRWRPAIGLRHPGVRQVLSLLGPRVATVFFIQVIFLAQDNIASRLPPGAVSALVYGWLFMQVPETLIGTATATVLLPTLSTQFARHDQAAFRQALNHSLRAMLAFTLPSAAVLAVVLRPVVGLLGFNPAGTEVVVWTARAFLLGLSGHALLEIAVRGFYAQQDARTPLLAAAATAAAFVALALPLAPALGPGGIAMANSLAYSGEALLLWWLLKRRFPDLLAMDTTLRRAALGSAAGALLAFGLLRLPLPAVPLAVMAGLAGGALALPFILPEIRLLLKL